jgi:pyruvate,water dikinase
MIFFGILGKMVKNLNIPNSDSLQNDLLIAQGDIASTRPTREIIKITNWIRKDSNLKEVFKRKSEQELIALLLDDDDEQYAPIREKIKTYIAEFGARSMYELKLEVDSIKEDPTFLFTLLKNYLNNKPVDLNTLIHKEEKKREKAEEIVFAKLSGMKKHLFCWILKHTRMAIEDREELRFLRTKIFGIIRSLFTRIGRNFAQDGLIVNYRDIFFLRTDEVLELIEGRSIDKRSIRERILLRRKDFSESEKKDHLERMYFYGSIYKDNFVEIFSDSEVAMADEPDDPDLFQGVPCSPGVIQNPIKIIHSPLDAALNMEILVAKRTDPGWVPLFPSISGLIIERGSVLSHSAVVAREMGIPTIVGLRNITEKLNDNDIVRMDGSTGLVERMV